MMYVEICIFRITYSALRIVCCHKKGSQKIYFKNQWVSYLPLYNYRFVAGLRLLPALKRLALDFRAPVFNGDEPRIIVG
jgi:hypothetical protein